MKHGQRDELEHAPTPADSAAGRKYDAVVPTVGIGASAGGLEALKHFFAAMPANSGVAFVVVQHLDPSHESRMAEILAKHTAMPVVEARDGMPIQPDSIYTNPADKHVTIEHGRLKLSVSVSHLNPRKPIDLLLTSAAEDLHDRAICIILSGSSGTDGLGGVRAIREAGGMCMVQDPKSAQFPEMPQSVIDAGMADYVLPEDRMPQALLAYVQGALTPASKEDEQAAGEAADGLAAILELLRVRANSDYRHYKRTTVLRRVRRRMGLKQAADMAAYLDLLRKDAGELEQLAKDMLIGVSAFFRDSDAFEELRREVIVPLVNGWNTDAPIRAWVSGCATGEEAYSVAMLLLEAAIAAGKDGPIQVFASDVDEQALETARAGRYPAGISHDVSPERLQQFFTRQGDGWQVGKRLREAVLFSRHNLLTDPPFSKLDLVSCRNVLIYLEPAAQRKVLTLFSFALNPGGWLFLGKSEGHFDTEECLFEPVSKQERIYRLVRSNRRAAGEFPLYPGGRPTGPAPRERATPQPTALADANQEALLRHFRSSMVLTDPKGRILYFHGRADRYLGHPHGPASLNLLDLTQGLLSAKLRRAMEKALQQDEAVALPQAAMPGKDAPLANLTVLPVASSALGGKVLAVIFEDAQAVQRPDASTPPVEDEPLVTQLEAEVKTLRDELRSDAEEYGSASEELNAANEEVMSMNEELQSANEELEASKEELQSLNEELATVNAQLSERISELTVVNNDVANLMNATRIATVFLDSRLRIKRFTPSATELFNLIPSDVGRQIGHITQNFVGGEIAAGAERVLETLTVAEKEVQTQDRRWFTIRILPYRTLEDRIEGVVVTLSEVTRLKEAEDGLRYEKAYAQGIVETIRSPLLVLDGALRVLSANKAFYDLFQVNPAGTAGEHIFDLGDKQWNIPLLRQLLLEVIPKQAAFQDFEVEHDFPKIGKRTMLLNGRRLEGIGTEGRILLVIEDVTERRRDRDRLRTLAADLTRTEQRERERLARVLHDDLQQILVGAKFHLSSLHADVPESVWRKSVEQVSALIEQSLAASRSLTAELSPTILYEDGLHAALPWLARQMKAKHGIEVATQMNAKVAVDEEGVVVILFQAVRELLFNVVKHAGVKEASITLDRIPGERVRVLVSDKGAGFDPSELRAKYSAGSGMGIFGIRERLEHMGGSFAIESSPGAGTRITLIAPVRQPEEAAQTVQPGPTSPVPSSPAPTEPGPRKIRVMIVDDHAIVRRGLAGILKLEPEIEVIGEAADGAEAVERAHQLRPDVIVMDISMPKMNGIEATRAIHASLPDIRIIGLSMYAEADRADQMRQAGASAYLTKGGPADDLLAAIHACVRSNS